MNPQENPYSICFITSCMFTPNKEKGKGNLEGRRPKFFKKFGGYDFFLFTNNKNIKNTYAWDPVYISNKYLDKKCNIKEKDNIRKDVYRSRYNKWQGHKYLKDILKKEYDVIFWVDVNIVLNKNKDWQELAKIIMEKGLIQRKHKRGSAYGECNAICASDRDIRENTVKMKKYLENNNMPGLCLSTDNSLFGYNPKNKNITEAFDHFFKIYITEKITHRDQPLWWYILWKLQIKPVLKDLTKYFDYIEWKKTY